MSLAGRQHEVKEEATQALAMLDHSISALQERIEDVKKRISS